MRRTPEVSEPEEVMPCETQGDYYEIEGPVKLQGNVRVSGSKNASLAIVAATLLTGDEVILHDVPRLADVCTMKSVLKNLGARVSFDGNTMSVQAADITNHETSFELMNMMRASIYVMGPLLARFGEARVAMPGGCAIGSRPIDYHLAGFQQMGVEIRKDHGYIEARCKKLRGARVYLDFPSVGATANLMMAGALAEGRTVIENAAEEPHIQDLAWFLKSLGARVFGEGSKTITIDGVPKLHGATHRMIADQIEAGTFMVAAALTRGNVTIENARTADLEPIMVKLVEAGVVFREVKNGINVTARKKLRPVKVTTMTHPGFPTDMQPQIMALAAVADGVSSIKETVWENRFMHVAELVRMGADIDVRGNTAIITGVESLSGSRVVSTDLRAGAALVVAGLAARNETTVYKIYHIDRGYEDFDRKLTALGAKIVRKTGNRSAE